MESARPLSESGIWGLLMESYRDMGPDAWSSGKIPHRITSNGQMADVYASVAAGFLRDCAADPAARSPLILEIGGGNGLFAWLFLQRLLRHHFPADTTPGFTYLLTDAVTANVASWSEAPRLRHLTETGPLRTGVLRVGGPLEVVGVDGRRWTEDDLLSGPVFLIANYILDSLPCDLVRVRDHALYAEHIGFETRAESDPDGEEFHRLVASYESRELAAPRTGIAEVDAIVEGYRELDGDHCIPVPVRAAEFLTPLLAMDHRFIMLAGDLAFTTPSFGVESPLLLRDYVACPVNFDLLGRLVEAKGGETVLSPEGDTTFTVGAFMRANRPEDLSWSRYAARLTLTPFTPFDAFNVAWAARTGANELDFDGVMGWLRLNRYDPHTARLCIPQLLRLVTNEKPWRAKVMRDALLESLRCDVPELSDEAIPLDEIVGFLFLSARMYNAAEEVLEGAIREIGKTPARMHMLALARARLGRGLEADELWASLLSEQPDYLTGMPGDDGGRNLLGPEEEDDSRHLNHLVLRASVAEFRRMRAEVDRPRQISAQP